MDRESKAMLVPDLEKEFLQCHVGTLKTALRVNLLRHGYSGIEIDDLLIEIEKSAMLRSGYDPSKIS